jgi:hypothetical protein
MIVSWLFCLLLLPSHFEHLLILNPSRCRSGMTNHGQWMHQGARRKKAGSIHAAYRTFLDIHATIFPSCLV